MAAFYLFVVIAVKQFVYDVTLRCAIFQADSILFMGAKYRITRILYLRDTNKEKGGRDMLTPLSIYRLISGLQLRSDINS